MSAYVVSREHVVYLAKVAEWLTRRKFGFSYRYNDKRVKPGPVEDIAQLLWDENIRSVEYRYGTEDSLPGPVDENYKVGRVSSGPLMGMDYAQAFKSIHCLEYQSCEHPGWEGSQAYALLQAMSGALARVLPGYEEAAWGAPKVKENAHGALGRGR